MLIHNPRGHYRFLKGIDPYSCGVVADDGFEIVHVSLGSPLGWRQGFDFIASHLRDAGEQKAALCGMELRCPAPYRMEGFIGFNQDYCGVLREWGLYVDGLNPLARTNVAPAFNPPSEPQLFAFSFTTRASSRDPSPTFIVAGAGELVEGALDERGIVRRGDISAVAMHEKAGYVVRVMTERLAGLMVDSNRVTQINVYTLHPMDVILNDIVVPAFPSCGASGIRWYPSRPPVQEIEFEMDLRGLNRSIRSMIAGVTKPT